MRKSSVSRSGSAVKWMLESAAVAVITLGAASPAWTQVFQDAPGRSAAPVENTRPVLVAVMPAGPDLLAVQIQQGHVVLGRQEPYTAQPDDRIDEVKHNGIVYELRLMRGGQMVGRVTGLKRDTLTIPDRFGGDELDTARADDVESYRLLTAGRTIRPLSVSRKAKPNQFARSEGRLGLLHTVYLRLPERLEAGETYRLDLSSLNLDRAEIGYRHDPSSARSEAVHVNQNGFEPRDPRKYAYVSLWTGASGGVDFGATVDFKVIDESSGEAVFSGTAPLYWPADKPEQMHTQRNHLGAPAYRLDFTDLTTPGRYRVFVDGVGCSYPFDIRHGVWERAFSTSLWGLYHQRSGIALEPPYTDFYRPRCHHPDDGYVIRQSTATLMDTDMGLNYGGKDSFAALRETVTDEVVPNAWGGYQDAGDWDRRSQHLSIPRTVLELYELNPAYFGSIKLRIPETTNDLPDVIDEGLWCVDFYRRLQTADGGVRGGIEADAHPAAGDTSWTEILPLYAYAPDPWTTYMYAAAASRAAHVLKDLKPEMSRGYLDSARRAMAWAEKQFAGMPRDRWAVYNERNLAAIELYRSTGDRAYLEIFMEHSILKDRDRVINSGEQRDALFVYTTLPDDLADPALRVLAKRAVLHDADACVDFAAGNIFGIASTTAGRPPMLGYYSGPVDSAPLVRAHHLSGDARYLATMVNACHFGLGANPDNLSYTTGLGSAEPFWVLKEDAIKVGQKTHPGVTLYGLFDFHASFASDHDNNWWYTGLKFPDSSKMTPAFFAWPVTESYIDMWNWLCQNEYTPQQTFAPSAYVWGYLASQARP